MRHPSFQFICATLAAVRCLNSGQSVRQIAESAKRQPSTVRRWVKRAGFRKVNGSYTNA